MSTFKKVLYSIEDIVAKNSDNMYVWEHRDERITIVPVFLFGKIASLEVTQEYADWHYHPGIKAREGWHVRDGWSKHWKVRKPIYIAVDDLPRWKWLIDHKYNIEL